MVSGFELGFDYTKGQYVPLGYFLGDIFHFRGSLKHRENLQFFFHCFHRPLPFLWFVLHQLNYLRYHYFCKVSAQEGLRVEAKKLSSVWTRFRDGSDIFWKKSPLQALWHHARVSMSHVHQGVTRAWNALGTISGKKPQFWTFCQSIQNWMKHNIYYKSGFGRRRVRLSLLFWIRILYWFFVRSCCNVYTSHRNDCFWLLFSWCDQTKTKQSSILLLLSFTKIAVNVSTLRLKAKC